MSTLTIQKQILDVDEMIAGLRDIALHHPKPSVFAQIRSLEKEQRKLRSEFDSEAQREEQDIFRYVIQYPDRPTILGISAAWVGFQNAFSELYALFKQPPKKKTKSRPGEEPLALDIPQLGWGYEFSGSLGLAMTLPTRSGLWNDPISESAVRAMFKIGKTEADDDLAQMIREYGPQAIASMYKWANIHAVNGYGVSVDWVSRAGITDSLVLPSPKINSLRDRLATTKVETKHEINGSLVVVNYPGRECLIIGDNGKEITATFQDAITEQHYSKVPSRYTAYLLESKPIVGQEGKEIESSYFLVSLSAL